MRKRHALFMLLGCAVLASVAIWQFHRTQEPIHHGRTLSEWLRVYSAARNLPATMEPRASAARAVRDIGTNALPFLVAWIGYEPKPWQNQLFWSIHTNRAPAILAPLVIDHRKAQLKIDALAGFEILGPLAVPAIPGLIQLLKDTNAPPEVTQAFLHLGDAVIAPLAEMLSDPDVRSRRVSPALMVSLLSEHPRTNPNDLVLALARVKADSDPVLAGSVSQALRSMLMNSQVTVATITNCLTHPDPGVRTSALYSLLMRGPEARPIAISAARIAVRDPDPGVQRKAMELIAMLDTEAFSVLVDLLGNPNEDVALNAAGALERFRGLERFRSKREMAVAGLILALQDARLNVRVYAADVLATYGPAAAEAVPALLSALHAPEERMRTHATNALRRIQPEALADLPPD